MKVEFERDALVAVLEREFGTPGIVLGDIPVGCSWPVFRAEVPGLGRIFVKIGSNGQISRMYAFLKAAGRCRLFPEPLTGGPVGFGGHSVACLSWQTGRRIDAEMMTPAQTEGFARGCVELSGRLQCAGDVIGLSEAEESPANLARIFAEYSERHPLARRALDRLEPLIAGVRGLGGFPTATIHGDFQPRNYGFEGDEMSAVFDFDDLTESLPCADAAYAFVERARRHELSASDRHRLMDNFRTVMRLSPWTRGEWKTAVGYFRLRIAARRLVKHMGSPLVALNVRYLDRLPGAFDAEI